MQKYILLCLLVICSACHRKMPPQIPSNQETIDTERQNMLIYNQLCIEAEQEDIKKFIDSSEYKMTYSDNGFWYYIIEKGNGKKVRNGQIVKIAYSLELLDGTVCYSTDKNRIKTFEVGKRKVEKGLDIAMPLFAENSEAVIIMPSHLAHGVVGDRKCIPARTPILYRIKILSVK
ncbi:MAG: hypothetical protein EOL95_06300 [Bacteroidia bacterium]|nr:hypothetical protein [Bacteroidia bacterium]